jgi:hypothetical protein
VSTGNVAFYTWTSLGCPSAIGWLEELVAAVGRPTTVVLRGKDRFAFVGMFPHKILLDIPSYPEEFLLLIDFIVFTISILVIRIVFISTVLLG